MMNDLDDYFRQRINHGMDSINSFSFLFFLLTNRGRLRFLPGEIDTAARV